jgi:hypothetical protein
MGTRSDVGVALHSSIVEEVKAKHFWLFSDADKIIKNDGHVLIIFEDYKWYDTDDDIVALNKTLKEFGRDKYVYAIACPESPNADEVYGDWIDNPWNLGLNLTISLSYEEVGNELL